MEMEKGCQVHLQFFKRDGFCFVRDIGRIHVVAIVCEHVVVDNRYRVFVELEGGELLQCGCFKSGKAASKRIDDIDWALFANRVLSIPYKN